MEDKVRLFIRKYHMIEEGDTVVTGVSGGADSVCLLFMLSQFRQSVPFELVCVHINHMIRESAYEDEAYVEWLCKQLSVTCETFHIDVTKLSKEKKLSLEEAGREARYGVFYDVLGRYSQGKIAVAHHKNDCAETMLFQLFRGSGIKGIGGIKPVQNKIIRPLLCLSREEIEKYLLNRKISWQTDETNLSDDYARNKIRHRILPQAEEICPNALERMTNTAQQLWEIEDYLKDRTAFAYNNCVKEEENVLILHKESIEKLHPAIASRVLLLAVENKAGKAKDIGTIHIKVLENLFSSQVGRRIELPYGICAERVYEGISLKDCENNSKVCAQNGYEANENNKSEVNLELYPGAELDIPGLGKLFVTLKTAQKNEIIPQKTYTKWFDYDKIEHCLMLRTRRSGDFLMLRETGERQSLKSYLINEKIPAAKRDKLFVIADGSHILWIVGQRISSYYKITKESKNILQICIGGKENG